MQTPSESNFQPWKGHETSLPSKSPKLSGAPWCGQMSRIANTVPSDLRPIKIRSPKRCMDTVLPFFTWSLGKAKYQMFLTQLVPTRAGLSRVVLSTEPSAISSIPSFGRDCDLVEELLADGAGLEEIVGITDGSIRFLTGFSLGSRKCALMRRFASILLV